MGACCCLPAANVRIAKNSTAIKHENDLIFIDSFRVLPLGLLEPRRGLSTRPTNCAAVRSALWRILSRGRAVERVTIYSKLMCWKVVEVIAGVFTAIGTVS